MAARFRGDTSIILYLALIYAIGMGVVYGLRWLGISF